MPGPVQCHVHGSMVMIRFVYDHTSELGGHPISKGLPSSYKDPSRLDKVLSITNEKSIIFRKTIMMRRTCAFQAMVPMRAEWPAMVRRRRHRLVSQICTSP
jgi:hypothetical protein